MKRLLLATVIALSTVLVLAATLYRKATAEEQPAITRAVAPSFYPPIAKQARASSKVIVEVTINPIGKVVAAKSVEGHPLFRKIAETAALQWLFVSGTDGRLTRLTFTFIAGEDETGKVSFILPREIEFVSPRPDVLQTPSN